MVLPLSLLTEQEAVDLAVEIGLVSSVDDYDDRDGFLQASELIRATGEIYNWYNEGYNIRGCKEFITDEEILLLLKQGVVLYAYGNRYDDPDNSSNGMSHKKIAYNILLANGLIGFR